MSPRSTECDFIGRNIGTGNDLFSVSARRSHTFQITVSPIIDGLTIGLKVLLMFIGTLTLGIGGVGVMNIMLVSVEERVRKIGLLKALAREDGISGRS